MMEGGTFAKHRRIFFTYRSFEIGYQVMGKFEFWKKTAPTFNDFICFYLFSWFFTEGEIIKKDFVLKAVTHQFPISFIGSVENLDDCICYFLLLHSIRMTFREIM